MDVEKAELKVQHGLARDAKPEMSGFDDAGMDGSDGNLEHPFARHRPERVKLAWRPWNGRIMRKILA